MLSKLLLVNSHYRCIHSSNQRTFSNLQRHIHVLGYPFAGGQGRAGPELSPAWLFTQQWIQNRKGVSLEMIDVSNPNNNNVDDKCILHGHRLGQKNWNNVLYSCQKLEEATDRTLRRDHFPIVFGGDHSQGIGSINGLKNVFPETRILWVDAHVDANTPLSSPSGNVHGCPVGYLAGLFPYVKKPVLSLKHLMYFGLRQWEDEEKQLIIDQKIPWVKSEDCLIDRMDEIKIQIENHMFPDGKKLPYWISFDIDSIDQAEFKSTGTPESQGITIDFMLKFFETFLPEAVGMDFSEVNFMMTEGEQTEKDEKVVKLIFDKIAEVVHNKQFKYNYSNYSQWQDKNYGVQNSNDDQNQNQQREKLRLVRA
eukprot:403343088